MRKRKNRTKIAIGVAIGLAGIIYFATKAGAEPQPPQPPPPGLANLYGKVTDSITGNPISGVLIALNGLQTQSSSGGNYQFIDLEPGTYTIAFEKEGYETVVV